MLTLACYRVAGMHLANFQSLSSVLLYQTHKLTIHWMTMTVKWQYRTEIAYCIVFD